MNIPELAKNAGKIIQANSPSILSGLAVTGVVMSSVFAVRGTPRALQDIAHAASEQTAPLTRWDKVRLTWRYYVPALCMGAATIACIVGANSISARRNAALVSVYSLTEKALSEYKAKVVETLGEQKETAIRDSIAQDRVDATPLSSREVIITGGGDVLCFDPLSSRYFTSNIEAIRKAQNDINEQVINFSYATLNDFYQKIGINDTSLGEDLGWNTDKLLEVKFSPTMSEDDKPCISLDITMPTDDFQSFR